MRMKIKKSLSGSSYKILLSCFIFILGINTLSFAQSSKISPENNTRKKTKMSAAKTSTQESTLELKNDAVELLLGLTPQGAPVLVSGKWIRSGEMIFTDIDTDISLDKWFPVQHLLNEPLQIINWRRTDDVIFLRAESVCVLPGGFTITWIVELDRESPLVRLRVRASNNSREAVKVPWFPAWNGVWAVPGDASNLRYWEPLSYLPHQFTFDDGETKLLGSRLHSSDVIENGTSAYWLITGDSTRLYFGMDWCGGWRAELKGIPGGLDFRVFLPEEETQLILEPGESIDGPAIMITPLSGTDESLARAEWMKIRRSLAARMYGGPSPSFPFSWNHWYAVRFGIDGDFLSRQVKAMDPYGFDYFVIDAGWYKACGDWVPHPDKFSPGEFEDLLKQVRDKGIQPGIWTCPQFVKPGIEIPSVLKIDKQPGFYRSFIDGMLVDLDGSDFDTYLVDHVKSLCKNYNAAWWKYDQDFFVAESSAGQMKNVVALQEALKKVRSTFPDLYIESCQSGGRMLNEFTVLSSQAQWIRDGSRTGLVHARSNFQEAIRSMEFLPPWSALRWTNRPDENNQDDDEFTRMYCRSAMAGTWGVVADLPHIGEHQRSVILKEADHYRRLSELKYDCLYDIFRPEEGAPAAGIIFYSADGSKAGLLFLRWDAKDAFNFPVSLTRIQPGRKYRVEFVDTEESFVLSGDILKDPGMALPFSETCMSFLVFIEAVD